MDVAAEKRPQGELTAPGSWWRRSEKLGLKVLSRAWVNTDGLSAATFVLAAGITLFT